MNQPDQSTELVPTELAATELAPLDPARYAKQILFAGIGEAGQRRIAAAHVLVVGCGALGTVIAESLARAGVGRLRIVDRDFVELSNLQRQVLFDEQDVADHLPKAVAAVRKLERINSAIALEPVVADVNASNILGLMRDVDLVLDGADNFEVRYLVNDASLETGIPWIYGGCVGSHGQTLAIFPHQTACLRCLIESAPGPGEGATCDTAGVVGPIVNVIASLQVTDALKYLSGQRERIAPFLTVVDVWEPSLRRMSVAGLRERANCPACQGGERAWLSGTQGSRTAVLCGRNAVQVSPPRDSPLDLAALATRLQPLGRVQRNPYLLRFAPQGESCELTIFPNGRAIIKGTDDAGIARGLYARYLGS